MGLSKLNQYSELELALYEICKSIAHPARIRILNYLNIHGTIALKELPDLLELSISTIADHVNKLKNEGFVTTDFIDGTACLILLKADTIAELTEQISVWKTNMSTKLSRLERRKIERAKTKTKGSFNNLKKQPL